MSDEKTDLAIKQDHIEIILVDIVRIVSNIEKTVIAGFKNQGDRIDNLEIKLKGEISEKKSDIADLRYLIVKVLEKVSD